MKACPRCNSIHAKPGTYCSRSCANSREQTDEIKSKKSLAALNSSAVLRENRNPDKLKILSERAKEQHKNGKAVLPSYESRSRGGSNSWANRSRQYDESIKDDYRNACKFKFSLNEFPTRFDFTLIEKHGWYRASNNGNNPNGVSRDHMLSISDGWKLGVPAWKIAHPANCRLILHKENASKNHRSCISLEELDLRISQW
jgi:hypothetical protein